MNALLQPGSVRARFVSPGVTPWSTSMRVEGAWVGGFAGGLGPIGAREEGGRAGGQATFTRRR